MISSVTPSPLAEPASKAAETPSRDPLMWEQAKAFEAQFLSEMLKLADLGKTPEAFGGGLGEDAFAAMMVDEYAAAMVETNSIGLAEKVYESMAERLK